MTAGAAGAAMAVGVMSPASAPESAFVSVQMGGMVAWWHGGMVAWWHGGMVAWWHGVVM